MPVPGDEGAHDVPVAPEARPASGAGSLAGLIEDIPEAFVLYDQQGRIVYANEEFRHRMGRSLGELVGRRPFEWDDGHFADSAEVVRFRTLLDTTLSTGEPCDFTRSQPGLDGRRQTYRVSFRSQRDRSGRVVGAFMFAQDVSDLDHAHQRMAKQEHEFRVLTESLPDVIVRYDLDGRAIYANHRANTSGEPFPTAVLGLRPSEVDHPGMHDKEDYERKLLEVLRTGEPDQTTLTFDGADGRVIHSVLIRAERDADGSVCGAFVIGRDITDLVEARDEIARREREFRTLAENAKEFIGRWAPDGQRLYVNPALARLMGAEPEELVGRSSHGGADGEFADVIEAIRRCALEATAMTILHTHHVPGDGSRFVHEVQLVPEFDDAGHVVSVLGVGRDVTTVVTQREELEQASRTDSLTGAANRRVLYEELPTAVAEADREGRHVALVLADLDGFKHLNDQYGHTFGDRLLRAVAATLSRSTDRPVIRLGGDEFVIIVDVESPTDAALIAHGIQVMLSDLRHDGERFPPIDVSFGVSLSPHDGTDPDVLLAAADLALYAAKHQGRGRVEFFRPELRAASERRSTIEDALRSAVPDIEMDLHFQPICALGGSGGVWGVEALLRWQHPVLGAVSPVEFIPVAEQCGQIVPLGRWVLARAAAIATELNLGAVDPLCVCVNVSTRQFTLDDVVDAVSEALRTTGCDPRWLSLELTESLLLEDVPLVRDSIRRLRDLGVGIAIDDFGTGYSALHYLTKLRIDHMKIDKAFVRDVESDVQQQEVVRALIALANAIRVDVIAEGIETEGQAAFLGSLGCGLGQGFLLAKPLPRAQLVAWLASARGSGPKPAAVMDV